MITFKSLLPKNFINFRKALLWESQINIRNYADDKTNVKPDLYNTLGVESTATHVDIKKAYYDLTFKYHPDRNEGNIEASKKFREVTEAYEILGNYSLRKRYDKGLPVLFIKGKAGARQSPIVEKEVKYQKFFDSRTSVQKFEWKNSNEEESEDFDSARLRRLEEYRNHVENNIERDKRLETPLALFVGVLLIISFVYNGNN